MFFTASVSFKISHHLPIAVDAFMTQPSTPRDEQTQAGNRGTILWGLSGTQSALSAGSCLPWMMEPPASSGWRQKVDIQGKKLALPQP